MQAPFNVALVIPTGVGASIGGFGGDAMTLLPLFASVCDAVWTHPNVANAACFQTLPSNVFYVEGYGLDQVFRGRWGLKPVRQNRVGVIWDKGIPAEMTQLHQNVIAAVKTVYGVDIIGLEVTQSPVQLAMGIQASGRSAGRVTNPHVLIEAGQRLLNQGATALAVGCFMPEVLSEVPSGAYLSGEGVDPIGGLEAMISHALVAQFQIPVAHAPVFPLDEALPVTDRAVDAKAASEFMVSTFLPCVLTGLSKAPQFVPVGNTSPDCLQIEALSALVVPANALGGIPVLEALRRGIAVLTVANNQTVLAADVKALRLLDNAGVVACHSYQEALGRLVAMRQGITLPAHI